MRPNHSHAVSPRDAATGSGTAPVLPSRGRPARPAPSPLPWLVLACAVLGGAVVVLPLAGLGTRVAWQDLPTLLASPSARSALTLSLSTCVLATLISVTLGVPSALVLSRSWPGVSVARVLAVVPMTMPPVVAGIALLATFGKRGILGPTLESLGMRVAFTTAAVVIAQVFVSMPYLVVTLEAALRSRDEYAETVARCLGAGPWRVLTRITLPLIAPAFARGTALALGRSLGEFGATIAFAGSREGVTRTMPLAIYLERENDTDTSLALAVVLIALSCVVIGATALPWGRVAPYLRRCVRGRREASVLPTEDAVATSAPQTPAGPVSAEAVSGAPGEDATDDSPRGREVRLRFSAANRGIAVDLRMAAGESLALIGPNGSGKSTACEVLAGLLRTDDAEVCVGKRVIAGRGVLTPAGQRGIALLSQQPGVFTHMTVVDNVAFGLRCQGVSRKQARRRAHAELAAVGAAHLAYRAGHELSGGQAARVALARAMAIDPAVLVLDEPMAALDVAARAQLRALIAQRVRQRGLTLLLVTHDLLDLTALAQRVVVLEQGRVAQSGTVREVIAGPQCDFAARLSGTAVLAGVLEGEAYAPRLCLGAGVCLAGRPDDSDMYVPGSAGVALVPPEAVALYRDDDGAPQPGFRSASGPLPVPARRLGSPRNDLPVRVVSVNQAGSLVTVGMQICGIDEPQYLSAVVTAAAVSDLGIDVDVRLRAVVKAVQVRILPSWTSPQEGPASEGESRLAGRGT